MDDIFDMLESKEATFNTSESKPKTGGFERGKSMGNKIFERNDWKGEKLDSANFNKSEKAATIAIFVGDLQVPTEVKEKLMKIVRALVGAGYKIRLIPDRDSEKIKDIEQIEGIGIYPCTPWYGYKQSWGPRPTKDFGVPAPTEKAYNIAAELVKNFNNFQGTIRAYRATAVHSMLGKDCVTPSSLLLCYTPGGEEQLSRDTNFKAMGSVPNYIKIATEANIPVFNIAKQESITRLSEWLKANN